MMINEGWLSGLDLVPALQETKPRGFAPAQGITAKL
jgi:hypothetical protein